MGITITDYGTNIFNTQINTQQSPFPVFSVTSVRQSEIDFSINFQGTTYQVITKGNFDPAVINLSPTTAQDILNSGLPTSVTNFLITSSNNPVWALSINPGISLLSLFSLLRGSSLSDFSALSGDDIYYTNSVAKESAIYLYDGNDTIYENHLVTKSNDLFYGGDGTDTVVYQGKSTDFTITYSKNIWDNLNSKNDLEGFIVKDNKGMINTAQINGIEKLQFSDQTIDLMPYLSNTPQSITFRDYGISNTGTLVNAIGTPPASSLTITKFTSYEVDVSVSTYTGIIKGIFDTSSFSKMPQSVSDLSSSASNFFVNSFSLSNSGVLIKDQTFTKALNFGDFYKLLYPSSNSDWASLLQGDDVFYTSTNGDDTSNNQIHLYDGNDTLYENQKLIKYNDIFYGGAGTDTAVFSAKSSYFNIMSSNSIYDDQSKVSNLSGFVISDNTKAVNTLQINQVEKIQFSDFTLDTTSLTKTANLSKAALVSIVELYIASFNRAPDSVGLDYWGGRLSDGMSLQDIAKSFFVQKETVAAYPTTMSTSDFVSAVYNNVLSRGPDTGGLNYWVGQLTNGSVSKDAFLLAIINGAMASTGSAVDRQTLANKEAVGEHYAIYQGLNNSTYWAKDVMLGVTDQASTVTAANIKADAYATIAANPATSDLVVKLVGIAV